MKGLLKNHSQRKCFFLGQFKGRDMAQGCFKIVLFDKAVVTIVLRDNERVREELIAINRK